MSVFSIARGSTRHLLLALGQYGLLVGPVRRAVVEHGAHASDELLRLLVCHYGKRLSEAGLIAGTCGNLSARAKDGRAIYVTRRSINKARLSHSDVRRVELDSPGPEVESVSVELPMHRACYLASSSVGAVIHTHGPALTAVGTRGLDFDAFPESTASLGAVHRIPYAHSGSEELGDMVAAAVTEGAGLMLLERHGAVTVGRDLVEAFDRMEFGELTARAALLVAGTSLESV